MSSPASQISSQPTSFVLLLVEADDSVRRFLFWALYLEGFRVLTAKDAEEAARLSRDVPGSIAVLIIGALNDGLSPETFQKELEAERPELVTLLLRDASVDPGQLIERVKAIAGRSLC